jgi:hypothetical protein
MSDRIPLGEKEGPRLEFKGADALKDPEKIAREVVALLNADGGEVWVGLREEAGRAVAVDTIQDLSRERRRLLDSLIDRIEPSPASNELEIREVPQEDPRVLCISVSPEAAHQPYAALLTKGGRDFSVRVGDRIAPMSRPSLARAFREESARREVALDRANQKIRDKRNALQEKGEGVLWVSLEPLSEIEIDIQDRRIEDYLRNPELTGNRSGGWTFSDSSYRPIPGKDLIGTHPDEVRRVEIRREGGMEFRIPLTALNWKVGGEELWPYCLLEYPISAMRLARRIYLDKGRMAPNDLILADLALIGIQGWKLRPNSPGAWFLSTPPRVFSETKDLVWDPPLIFRFEELDGSPDLCGFRLVARVYEAFGYRREQIPREFDQKAGRLILPD